MTKERDIGAEILDRIRELKQGKSGWVVNVPAVTEIREKTGLSQTRFAALDPKGAAGKGGAAHY